MKKLLWIGFTILSIGFLLSGCSRMVRPEEVAGKTYCYEKEGFGGPFTIRLEEDNSFTYYEGFLSSIIGVGEWSLDGGIVTLREKDRSFSFRVEEDALVFREMDSDDFIFVDVADGERFPVTGEQ